MKVRTTKARGRKQIPFAHRDLQVEIQLQKTAKLVCVGVFILFHEVVYNCDFPNVVFFMIYSV